MLYTAPKTVTKTTTKLSAGDVVLTGNCVMGFDSFTIVDVTRSSINKRRALIVRKYNHGGMAMTYEGTNARWDVIVKEAN